MTFALICLLAASVLAFAERSLKHIAFALAVQCLIAATFALIVGDLDRAILLSALVTAMVVGASTVKYRHSGLKLVVTDLPLMFAGTVPFFIVQYPRAVASVLVGALASVAATVAINLYVTGPQIPLSLCILLFSVALVACGLTYRISGRATAFRKSAAEPRCYFSAFMASLVDALSWRQAGSFALSDIASEPLALLPALPARSLCCCPDIIIIQHESVFDPRLFGLPVEPTCEALLTPKDGLYGSLHVDIFGGGSWQSEFSVLTGLSSASFGPNAYFLFKKGAGRFHHSLPGSLAALGYKTMLTSSCRRSFLNYDDFYSSIGVSERMFTDDFAPPFDIDRFEATGSDGQFLQAAFDAFAAKVAADPSPRFLYALTNFNHGPHSRRLASAVFERERSFAMASLPDVEYAEYYARLAETAATWQRVKSDLKARFPGRPMLIVHYGDHQPVMVRRIEKRLRPPEDPRRQFRTFYAVEAINMDAGDLAAGRRRNLDIAFLGTIALQRAGLPLDPIYATRASLLDSCGASYFAADSETKRRFHRTLVELGLIDCDPSAAPLRPMILQR